MKIRRLIVCSLSLFAATCLGAAEPCPGAWPSQHVQRHNAERRDNMDQQGHPLYELDVYEDTLFDDTYQVSLKAQGTAHPMEGFIAISEAFGSNSISCGNGSFLAPSMAVRRRHECANVLVSSGGNQQTSAIFRWTPPRCGCVKLRATIIAVTREFYIDSEKTDSGPLTKTICVEDEDPEDEIDVFVKEDDLANEFHVKDLWEEILDESDQEDEDETEVEKSSEKTVEKDVEKESLNDEEEEEADVLTTMTPTEETGVEKERRRPAWMGRKQWQRRRKNARRAKKQIKRKAKWANKKSKKKHFRKVLKVLRKKKQQMKKARIGKRLSMRRFAKRMKHIRKTKSRFRRHHKRNMTQICMKLRNLPTEPHRRFHKKWHKKTEAERIAIWRQKVATATACCNKQAEVDQKKCFLDLKKLKIDVFCSGQGNVTATLAGHKHIKELCCKRTGEEKYNCFNRTSDSFWKKEMKKTKRGRFSVRKLENMCRKMSRHDEPHSRFMKKWQQLVPSWIDRVRLWQRKRGQIMQCCDISEHGNKSQCFQELKKQRMDSLCVEADDATPRPLMATELLQQLRQSCCAKQDDERYSCMWEFKTQHMKARRNKKHAHQGGAKRRWWKRPQLGDEVLKGNREDVVQIVTEAPTNDTHDEGNNKLETAENQEGEEAQEKNIPSAELERSCCDAGKTMGETLSRRIKLKWRHRKCARKAIRFAQMTHPDTEQTCREEYQRCCQYN